MKKMYCLVVIDDYSRFTCVFFLATKDETSGFLTSFITKIENLANQKVKVFRCDNGTEFKNRDMHQFCEMKRIMRQFSVFRTPQQNRFAKRRNMTLIEAARTMLADSIGPDWLFDIDALTRIMNCEPIVAGTQSNGFVDPKSSHDDGSKPSCIDEKKVDKDLRKENDCNDQEKEDNVNNTNNVNIVSSTVNATGINEEKELPFDPNMHALEDVSIINF
nr:putative ribonuclease H-like domain-containing protein [Tanacetum cinerariifolium]